MSENVEWVRPAEAPEWGRRDVAWWWVVDDMYRLPEGDEVGRKCSARSCPNECRLVRVQTIRKWAIGTEYTSRSFRCDDHIYREYLIEDGRVLMRRPRFGESA